MSDPVRPLLVIAAVEALAVVAVVVADIAAMVGGTAGVAGTGAGAAAVGLAIWVVFAAGLVLIWWGLYRRRLRARTPFLLVQAFVLVLVPLFWGSDLLAWRLLAVGLALMALGGIVLALRSSVRSTLA